MATSRVNRLPPWAAKTVRRPRFRRSDFSSPWNQIRAPSFSGPFREGVSMDKIEECWVNAARAFFEAQAACDPEDRRMMLRIAKAWLELAKGNPVLIGGETECPDVASRPYSERN
jgi:hypothetical protein